MGLTEKRHMIRTMFKRWQKDEARLRQIFGDRDEVDGYDEVAEMQRNLGTAVAYAERYLSKR